MAVQGNLAPGNRFTPPSLSPSEAAILGKAQLQAMSAGITEHTSLTQKLSICAQLVGRLRQSGDC